MPFAVVALVVDTVEAAGIVVADTSVAALAILAVVASVVAIAIVAVDYTDTVVAAPDKGQLEVGGRLQRHSYCFHLSAVATQDE